MSSNPRFDPEGRLLRTTRLKQSFLSSLKGVDYLEEYKKKMESHEESDENEKLDTAKENTQKMTGNSETYEDESEEEDHKHVELDSEEDSYDSDEFSDELSDEFSDEISDEFSDEISEPPESPTVKTPKPPTVKTPDAAVPHDTAVPTDMAVPTTSSQHPKGMKSFELVRAYSEQQGSKQSESLKEKNLQGDIDVNFFVEPDDSNVHMSGGQSGLVAITTQNQTQGGPETKTGVENEMVNPTGGEKHEEIMSMIEEDEMSDEESPAGRAQREKRMLEYHSLHRGRDVQPDTDESEENTKSRTCVIM